MGTWDDTQRRLAVAQRAFKVIVPGGGTIQTGHDYACDGAYIVFVYQIGPTASHTTQSCTINVTALGGASSPGSRRSAGAGT